MVCGFIAAARLQLTSQDNTACNFVPRAQSTLVPVTQPRHGMMPKDTYGYLEAMATQKLPLWVSSTIFGTTMALHGHGLGVHPQLSMDTANHGPCKELAQSTTGSDLAVTQQLGAIPRVYRGSLVASGSHSSPRRRSSVAFGHFWLCASAASHHRTRRLYASAPLAIGVLLSVTMDIARAACTPAVPTAASQGAHVCHQSARLRGRQQVKQ
jgi:hypothetical protein